MVNLRRDIAETESRRPTIPPWIGGTNGGERDNPTTPRRSRQIPRRPLSRSATPSAGTRRDPSSVAWSPDGLTLASASFDRTVRPVGGIERPGHPDPPEALRPGSAALAFSPDGLTIASASFDRTVRLWEASSGRAIRTLKGHADSVFGVSWSRDGLTIASASRDKTVRLWGDIERPGDPNPQGPRWGCIRRVVVARRTHSCLGVQRQTRCGCGRHRAAERSGPWRTTLVMSIACHGRLTDSASHRRLDDKTVRLWQAPSCRPICTLEGALRPRHERRVVSRRPSSRLGLLASQTVRLWLRESWQTVTGLPWAGNGLGSPAFNPRSPTIVTIAARPLRMGTEIQIWDYDPKTLIGRTARAGVPYTTSRRRSCWSATRASAKRGLGWRLAHDKFKEHPSTHGQQFWVLDEVEASTIGRG